MYTPISSYVGIMPQIDEADRLATPRYSLQIAKGAEMFFHSLPMTHMHMCLPGDAAVGARTHSNVIYERALKNHVRTLTRNLLEKSFDTACSIMHAQLQDPQLRLALEIALREPSEELRYRYFCNLAGQRHIYYVFAQTFKSVSWDFVYHPLPRNEADEEKIRVNLQKHFRITMGVLIFGWYRYVLQAAPGGPQIERSGVGRAAVKANPETLHIFGPMRSIPKDVMTLPAAPEL